MLQKLNKIYPLQYEAIPLFLVFLIIFITISNFGNLPEAIPTHFDLAGLPDGWGSRNEILVYVGIGLFVYILITGICIVMAASNNPIRFINLPRKTKESLSASQVEKLRVFTVQYLFVLKILVTGLNSYLVYGNIEVALQRAAGIGYWPLFFAAGIMAVSLFMVYKIFRLTAPSKYNGGAAPY